MRLLRGEAGLGLLSDLRRRPVSMNPFASAPSIPCECVSSQTLRAERRRSDLRSESEPRGVE